MLAKIRVNNLVLTGEDMELIVLLRTLKFCLIEIEVKEGKADMVRTALPEGLDKIEPTELPPFDLEKKLIKILRAVGFGVLTAQIENGLIVDYPWQTRITGSFMSYKIGLEPMKFLRKSPEIEKKGGWPDEK